MNNVCEKFKNICQLLNVGIIELNDIVKIGDRLFQIIEIFNDEKQKKLLLVAKKLKKFKRA